MATLRELKGRIGSVKSSEKITGAMKMISSAKMHKAEQAPQASSALPRTDTDYHRQSAFGRCRVLVAVNRESRSEAHRYCRIRFR